MIYLQFILLIFLLIISFIYFLSLLTPLFSRVPFVPTRDKVLEEIIKGMNLRDGSVLYDLGCGDGRILFMASKINKNITCVGIERAPFPFLCAKIRQIFFKNKNVSILYGNMFKVDLSNASHVFLYLFPELMDSLLQKFEKELKKGSKVISSDFKFSKRQPDLIVNLKSKEKQLNRKLYIYNF